jgi:hypothetical protein
LSQTVNFNKENVKAILGMIETTSDDLSINKSDFDSVDKTALEERRTFPAGDDTNAELEIVHYLEGGILNGIQPLPSNTEVKLSFDRAKAAMAFLYSKDVAPFPTDLDNEVIDLLDPYLEVEYITSPYLRNYQSQIVDRPLTIMYDDCNVYLKSIQKGISTIRVDNLMGGLAPDYLYAGFIRTDALGGDFKLSSTCFAMLPIEYTNLTMNGMSVQGFPISSSYAFPLKLFCKFNETNGKTKKTMAGGSLTFQEWCWTSSLISHKFEGEQTNEGWMSFDLKLSSPTTQEYTMGES